MNLFLIALFTFITSFYILFGLKGIRNTNPVFLFSLLNWIYAVGILQNLDFSIEADQVHSIVLFLTAVLFYIGSYIVLIKNGNIIKVTNKFHTQKLLMDINRNVLIYLFFLVLFSILLSAFYYYKVGYNVFLISIKNLLATGSVVDNLSTLRLESYAGENYFAPGYVNQFKNILLPFVLSILYIYAFLRKNKKLMFFCISMIPLAIIFLLGTGQRGAFVQAMLIIFLTFSVFFSRNYLFKKYYKKFQKRIFIFTLLIFLIATVAGGRAGEGSFIVGAFQGVFHRIFESNQSAAIAGFRYVYSIDIQWGYEWFENIRGILPRYKGSDLSNIIFEIFYGSRRGTSPVSIWGSVWHNSGWFGTLFAPFFLGMMYAKIYLVMISGKRTIIRISSYAAGILIISYWGAGSAVQLINNGLLAIVIFYYSSRFLYRIK